MIVRAIPALLALALSACATAAPDDISVACARGRPGPIEGEWALDRIDGVPWRASAATLLAETDGFAGTLACNGFGTSAPGQGGRHYAIERGRLEIRGEIVTTSVACFPIQTLAFEAAFLAILDGSPHVAQRADALCLYTDDGRSLEFRRQDAGEAS